MTKEILDAAERLRKYLHKNPELSCQEVETSAHLKALLEKECKPDELLAFKKHGLVAVYKGVTEGKNVLIRGDFDALPIQETNDFEHKSQNQSVSHKCGHDGHASILYGLARVLADERPSEGTAYLLFQPAEENGDGAVGMMEDPLFKKLNPDYAVALHNLPGYDLHEIVFKEGPFTAAANSIVIKLAGKTAHAAEPEMGVNPALAMAQITSEILVLNKPDLDSDDFQIATPIYSTMGEKSYGVSAGYGELHFTLRAWKNDVIQNFEKRCEEIARRIASNHNLEIGIEWTESFFANNNDSTVVKAIQRVANQNGLKVTERNTPFKWGEDFGIFTEKYAGAMFGIGAGVDSPALHNPDYDFPDELIETGIKMFHGLISKLQD
ncbi:MAG: amidohydrolase [Cyclobacteriaceae bacterium]